MLLSVSKSLLSGRCLPLTHRCAPMILGCACHRTFGNIKHVRSSTRKSLQAAGFTGALVTAAGIMYYWKDRKKRLVLTASADAPEQTQWGQWIEGLACYSLEEVMKHSSTKDRIWVTYRQGVYDITEFVMQHPGGNKILMAAGSSVEPFWLLYGVHQNPQVYDMLESMRIGGGGADRISSKPWGLRLMRLPRWLSCAAPR